MTIAFVFCILVSFSAKAQHNLYLDTLGKGLTIGTKVSLSLRTNDFIGILGIQGSIVWDTAILKYDGATYEINSAIRLDSTDVNVAANYLSFLWSDPAINPESVPDSTSLLTLNFTVTNTIPANSPVYLSNIPTPLQIVDSMTITPVTLKEFSGVCKEGIVNLQWYTANETNSSCFIIERSMDGKDFQMIDKVNARNDKAGGYYSYNDKITGNEKQYYRLQMVDKAGAFSYSKVIEVAIGSEKLFSICPNPVKDALLLKIQDDKTEKAIIQVVDALGKVVLQAPTSLNAGMNNIPFNVASLANGTYTLIIRGDDILQQKFIKH